MRDGRLVSCFADGAPAVLLASLEVVAERPYETGIKWEAVFQHAADDIAC